MDVAGGLSRAADGALTGEPVLVGLEDGDGGHVVGLHGGQQRARVVRAPGEEAAQPVRLGDRDGHRRVPDQPARDGGGHRLAEADAQPLSGRGAEGDAEVGQGHPHAVGLERVVRAGDGGVLDVAERGQQPPRTEDDLEVLVVDVNACRAGAYPEEPQGQRQGQGEVERETLHADPSTRR